MCNAYLDFVGNSPVPKIEIAIQEVHQGVLQVTARWLQIVPMPY